MATDNDFVPVHSTHSTPVVCGAGAAIGAGFGKGVVAAIMGVVAGASC
ncbi:hypothetical protein [Streptomyces aureus]|uniref:Uncharacterized protein n=1 Tax=Streptomyces aureus TaxID=193461 RepID=A0ABV4SCR1_9ACTN